MKGPKRQDRWSCVRISTENITRHIQDTDAVVVSIPAVHVMLMHGPIREDKERHIESPIERLVMMINKEVHVGRNRVH